MSTHRTQKNVTDNNAASIVILSPPPAIDQIPVPPKGFVSPVGGLHRGVKPRKVELVAMPDAVEDVRSFADFATTLGRTVPPQDEVAQVFEVATLWSLMRTASAAWDEFCAVQEGIAWTSARATMARLKPAFQLASAGDPSLPTKYPKLAAVLDAKKAIARKASSTRALNKEAIAKGKEPTHGAIGKKRKKQADRAKLASLEAAPAPAPAPAPAAALEPAPAPAPAHALEPAPAPAAALANGEAHA